MRYSLHRQDEYMCRLLIVNLHKMYAVTLNPNRQFVLSNDHMHFYLPLALRVWSKRNTALDCLCHSADAFAVSVRKKMVVIEMAHASRQVVSTSSTAGLSVSAFLTRLCSNRINYWLYPHTHLRPAID